MYYLYLFSKITKYIAFLSLALTFFSDLLIFKFLCLLILIDLTLDFFTIKCAALQVMGMMKLFFKYRGHLPSSETYQSEIDYILPFHGRWVAVNGSFGKEFSHSWGMPTQRYAYDFIILDAYGKSHEGEFDNCNHYYCYDKDVLSPADGVVCEVNDREKDSLIFPKGRFFSRARHIGGNYIVIRHGKNEFSTLAHLKKNSITVKVGDAVSQGQCIGKCGNTGNSSEPHLHFQLQAGKSFYSSPGLPLQFKTMHLSPVENYEKYDTRPHMDFSEIPNAYLTRGFAAENES